MEIFLNWLVETVQETAYYAPLAWSVLCIYCISKLLSQKKYHLWRPIRFAIIATGVSLIALIWYICIGQQSMENEEWQSAAHILRVINISSIAITALLWLFCVILYAINSIKLKKVRNLTSKDSLTYNIVAALNQLKRISPSLLTKRQKEKLERYRLCLYIKLGNLNAAEKLAKELPVEESFRYFVLYMHAHMSGDMYQAKRYIKQAEECIQKDTDHLVMTEILLDHGVSYVTTDEYPLAEEYFEKAAAAYRKYKLNNSELLNSIYYNWAFHQTRIHTGQKAKDAVWALVKEYESLIEPKKPTDLLRLFNLKLELLRQLGATREEIDRAVCENFQAVIRKRLPIANKCMFAASVVRIVWTGFLNPELSLNYLHTHMDVLEKLPPESRYLAYKEVNLLFEKLGGPMVERYIALKERAIHYMQEEAEKDLSLWLSSLPNEAVLARGQCLTERAGLQRKLPDYQTQVEQEYVKSAAALYRENHLHVDEIMARLNYIDGLCAPENLDEEYLPIMKEEMLAQLTEVESFLPKLADHPSLMECYIRCGFYYAMIEKYDACINAYRRYLKSKIALAHYAPWVQRYLMVLMLQVRALYFYQALNRVKEDSALQSRTEQEIQQRFQSFPHHDGYLDAVLLGRFLGYTGNVPVKTKEWPDGACVDGKDSHSWLWMEEFGLNIDICYGRFEKEVNHDRIFFTRHPLEAGTSEWIKIIKFHTNQDLPLIRETVFPGRFPQELSQMLQQIYEMIMQYIPEECPGLEEIVQLYQRTVLSVPGIVSGFKN